MHYSPTNANLMSECKRTCVLLICIIRFYSILFFYCCLSNKVFLTIEPPNATQLQDYDFVIFRNFNDYVFLRTRKEKEYKCEL